jgi:hypothetical protein
VRAVWAGAGDLDGVCDVGEAVLLANFGGPAFDLWSFDFDGGAAMAADEVVVVLVAGASAVAGFAVVASQGVELAGVSERSDLVVDSGQGDVLAQGSEFGVEFLGGAERVGAFQDGGEGALLPGGALLGRPWRLTTSVGGHGCSSWECRMASLTM